MRQHLPRSATRASLRAHEVPSWFHDAKLGIFIHWGLFSIPAFAPRVAHISDAYAEHYETAVAMTPYTEWYWNAIRVPESPSARFHREEYGGRPYESFREPFARGLEHWDPAAWARAFRGAGARYVVLVTKHHDGFCLWPSAVRNPMQEGWATGRDVVGELCAAVRAEGLRFGVYYSGGIDWTWGRQPLRTFAQFIGSVPGGEYPAYAEAQVRELVERYEPSVLWNDIAWPTALQPMLRLMADYYDAVPEGVVNDRWMHRGSLMKLLAHRPVQRALDALLSRQIRRAAARGEASRGIVPPRPAHYDFRTPEYTSFDEITAEKWEATRGMTASFAFNRGDREEDHEDADALVRSFVDVVSKNGNLLLNVGPRGEDAAIPTPQLDRLRALGAWLERAGEAVYGTRPFRRAEGETRDGLPVRFTEKGEVLYAIVLGQPENAEIRISGLGSELSGEPEAALLGSEARVRVRAVDGDLELHLEGELPGAPAHAFAIRAGSRPAEGSGTG